MISYNQIPLNPIETKLYGKMTRYLEAQGTGSQWTDFHPKWRPILQPWLHRFVSTSTAPQIGHIWLKHAKTSHVIN